MRIVVESITLTGAGALATVRLDGSDLTLAHDAQSALVCRHLQIITPIHKLPRVKGSAREIEKAWWKFFREETRKHLKH